MKTSTSRFLPVAVGASVLAFVAGACVQRSASNTTGLIETSAHAQIRNAEGLAALSSTFAQIANKVTPAVVNIRSETVIPGRELRDPFFDFFGGDFGGRRFREPDRTSQSLGSGVIVDGSGLIITNNHVINNATRITVTLSDKRRFSARLLGADAASDVAVLKIEGANLPILRWADSDRLQVGDIVLAVGSPFNLSSTVTQGIISAKGRADLGVSAFEDFLQTDAAINPGNSGGALVDINGNLVGINTAILSESGGNQGIGLAIPANLARSLGTELAQTGRVTRGWLGIDVDPLTSDVSDRLGLANQGGVAVTGLYGNAPAARIPWSERGTNIILSVNGTRIDSPGQLRNIIAETKPGVSVKMQVWSDGTTKEYTVPVGTRPARVQGV